jgi:hypothetical protein
VSCTRFELGNSRIQVWSVTKVWRSRGIAPLSLDFGAMAVSGQLHATSALPLPPVEMVASNLCWGGFDESEWRSGRFGEEKSRVEPRSHGNPALSCRCGVATCLQGYDAVVFREAEGSWIVATDRLFTPQPCGMRSCVILLLGFLTWICLTAGWYVRSDASDLMLTHSHSHKWHHAAAVMPANNVICARIAVGVPFSVLAWQCNL